MKVTRIQSFVTEYSQYLKHLDEHPYAFIWENIQHFQDHWHLLAEDFEQMFAQSLDSRVSRRLWTAYRGDDARQRMLDFIKMEPEWVRSMFRTLFDEDMSLGVRCSRFMFGCDELMKSYRKNNQIGIDTRHLHEDYRMISLYLGLRFPERYAIYDLTLFRNALTALEAIQIPEHHDFERYVKVLRVWHQFLQKEDSTAEQLSALIHRAGFYPHPSRWMAWDFGRFISQQNLTQ